MLKTVIFGLGLSALIASPSYAQIVVNSGGKAQDCYQKTKRGDPGKKSTIKVCEEALKDVHLDRKNHAATYINTAILYMRSGDYDLAEARYMSAIKKDAKIPEAYISFAANHIYKGQYQEAIDAIDTGIALGTEKMPEALYNRAMAHHRVGDYKLAYRDLEAALTYRPDWELALNALENYQVVSQPG